MKNREMGKVMRKRKRSFRFCLNSVSQEAKVASTGGRDGTDGTDAHGSNSSLEFEILGIGRLLAAQDATKAIQIRL